MSDIDNSVLPRSGFRLWALLLLAGFTAAWLRGQDGAPVLISRSGGGASWASPDELEKAAQAGNPKACAQLGQQLVSGNQPRTQGQRGVDLLEQAARAGEPSAAFRLGMMLENGDGLEQDQARAIGYFLAAAAGGVPEAFNNVGAAYAGGRGVKGSYSEALAWLILAANRGVGGAAQYKLRSHLIAIHRPEWIAAGEARAPALEAELRHRKVESFLPAPAALVYSDSIADADSSPPLPKEPPIDWVPSPKEPPVELISPRGRRWSWPGLGKLVSAADHGDSDAQAALGQVLLDGKLIPEDDNRAVAVLEQSAKAGNVDAAIMLAGLFTNGGQVAADDKMAFQYNLQAARCGSPQAMYNAGAFYANGRGTDRDFTEALAWLLVAKHYNVDTGSEGQIRSYLERNQPEQIPLAERRAGDYVKEIESAK